MIPPARQPARPRMRLVSWKAVLKGSLRGFATVELPIGLKLIDCPVLVGPNGPWARLPYKPVLDREGKHAKPDGKPQFAAVLEWRNRGLADRFSAAVVALVHAAHPDDLEGAPVDGEQPRQAEALAGNGTSRTDRSRVPRRPAGPAPASSPMADDLWTERVP